MNTLSIKYSKTGKVFEFLHHADTGYIEHEGKFLCRGGSFEGERISVKGEEVFKSTCKYWLGIRRAKLRDLGIDECCPMMLEYSKKRWVK